MPSTIPDVDQKVFHAFFRALLAQPVRPAKGLSPSNCDNHGQLLEVTVSCDTTYPRDYCWFNCLEHSLDHGGSVICGWALWRNAPDHFVAQHHAVWQSPEKTLFDLTPNDLSSTVLFVPDNRAPFDFHRLRAPFNYEWKGPTYQVWFASGGVVSPEFAIASLRPNDSEATRISRIQKLAVDRGLL